LEPLIVSIQIPDVELIFLAMVRILSALMLAPVFGHRSVPAIAKIALAACMAWLIVTPQNLTIDHSRVGLAAGGGLGPFVLEVIIEAVLGLLLGLAASVVFWAVGIAGDLVSLQMGQGFSGTVHASLEQASGPISQLYNIMATLIFLAIGGHRLWLLALSNSFATAPPYAFVMQGAQVSWMTELVGTMFTSALQMALPVMGTLVLADVVLGFLSRVLPALNAFVFGMPLKILVGLVAILTTLPLLLSFFQSWVLKAPANMQMLVK
jgi:flagellar biosynthetic protein FliR